MAQLDKTFPTNDCSICILAPKMADCYGHPNINVWTMSEVIGLEGSKGNFKAKVLKKARYVDENKCTGCGECLDACQFNALSIDGVALVQEVRCAGCGVCIQFCEQGALRLERRSGETVPPVSEEDWRSARRETLRAA